MLTVKQIEEIIKLNRDTKSIKYVDKNKNPIEPTENSIVEDIEYTEYFNGKTFKRISGIYQQLFDKEVTMWIESKTISEENIELLRNSYKHRFELIRFERTDV